MTFLKLIFFAVCKDSYVVYACCFDRVGKWSGFAESMRITTNTVIFRHLCHLALDHWRGRTLLLFCFCVILGNSWWFVKNSEIYLRWFLVICKRLEFLWDDSQWLMILRDFQKTQISLGQFLMICKKNEISLGWFSMICERLKFI